MDEEERGIALALVFVGEPQLALLFVVHEGASHSSKSASRHDRLPIAVVTSA